MATARLRKAFRYQPGDSQDDDDITEVLDEEGTYERSIEEGVGLY